MVYFIREKQNVNVAWYDGRLPSRKILLASTGEKRLGQSESTSSSRHSPNRQRFELITDLLAAYIETHMTNYETKSNRYQIVLARPKWSERPVPEPVKVILRRPFHYERFFAEEDKLLARLSEEDYLHLPPNVPYLKAHEYYQVVLAYPCSSKD